MGGMTQLHDRAPCNIAASLTRAAREHPQRIAMRYPGRNGRYEDALTYAHLDARSDAIAAGLAQHGIVRGTRTVVDDALTGTRQGWWFGYGPDSIARLDSYLRLSHGRSWWQRLTGIPGTVRLLLRPERRV